LDEPTNNLDPQARLFLWEHLRRLQEWGVTIVLTTHDMEEADRLCERIAIMDQGRLLALDTADGLKRLIPGGTVLEVRIRMRELPTAKHARGGATAVMQSDRFRELLESLPGVTKVEWLAMQARADGQPETHNLRVYASEDAGPLLASAAQVVMQEHAELLDLRFARPSLEDVFIYLTGRNLRS